MAEKLFFVVVCVITLSIQHNSAAVLRRSADSIAVTETPLDVEAAASVKAEFERQAKIETRNFLNGMFQAQIDYFAKVKQNLPPNAKRVQDIDTYIQRLQEAIKAEGLPQKDKMWRDTFTEFSDSAFLLNKQTDTLLSNSEYQKVLNDSGLEAVTKNFLVEVAAYFWKMAKVSGKAVEMTIDEQFDKLRQDRR